MDSSDVTTVVVSGLVALLVAVTTSVLAFVAQRSKLREELKTEFMAESAILRLLRHPRWGKRSFLQLSARLGGFEDNELRRLLVRAGAVRFTMRGNEYWGLIERNLEALDVGDGDPQAADQEPT